MERLFEKSLTTIKGVGEKRALLFSKLGVDSVGALLLFCPRAYDDWSNTVTLFDAPVGEPVFIRAEILSRVSIKRIRSDMTIYETVAADDTGAKFSISFYNTPYIPSALQLGGEYVFHGRVLYDAGHPQMRSPVFQPADKASGIKPVYPLTAGLTQTAVSQAVKNALNMLPCDIIDPLDSLTRAQLGLCGIADAIRSVHFPKDLEEAARARRRLSFDELLALQLGILRRGGRGREENAPVLKKSYAGEFFAALPFEPTNAQKRAVDEAMEDMIYTGRPMARLLQGDVGSGKTAVAAALCHSAVKCGYQAALMAPTEVLARQHYATFSSLAPLHDMNIALLTGSTTAAQKKKIYAGLSDGSVDIVIGTHALISDGVEFSSLALVITDEQHRFGVKQRAALSGKGISPHHLVMSATPIPRTLALMIYGDLDISVLDELPKGRIPVETYAVGSDKRKRAYGFIKKHVAEGKQAFVVCPLIEDENDTGLAAAAEFAEGLRSGLLSGCTVGLLHGRMKSAEKEDVMDRFQKNEISVLVSTTVIEVGVDVPNAVIMLIENAERFGLSQLHQLRGRVGRGSDKAYCILISDAKGDTSLSRLRTMTRTSDGFEIANEDLRLRGPGDFIGARQHGLPQLGIADLAGDMELLSSAQREAVRITKADPELKNHPKLKAAAERLFCDVGSILN